MNSPGAAPGGSRYVHKSNEIEIKHGAYSD